MRAPIGFIAAGIGGWIASSSARALAAFEPRASAAARAAAGLAVHERGLALVADRALAHLLLGERLEHRREDHRVAPLDDRALARARRGRAMGAALHHGLAVEVEVEASVQELLQLGRLVEVHRHRARARPENLRPSDRSSPSPERLGNQNCFLATGDGSIPNPSSSHSES